jgi:Winged helix-turn helix
MVLPNRAIFTEVIDRDHPEGQMLSVTITNGVIRQQALLADSSKKDSSNENKSAYKLVQPGDIAYNKMRAWQGAVGVSNYRGIVSPAYVVRRHRAGAESRYRHYLLRTPAFAKEAERWSYGITSDMWSLRPEHFKMIYGCLPPLVEQAAIVRFLDHVNRQIRRYIRAKQQLIKQLEEQKQITIHRAVTRGVDPNLRLKPSDVEWLGDVPEHWEVKRLKHIMDVFGPGIQMGSFGTSLTRLKYNDTGYNPPLYIGDVTDDERTTHEAGLRSSDAFTVRRCQILLASAEGHKPSEIAKTLRCAPQKVRNVLHAFNVRGLACMQRRSNLPITVAPVLNAEHRAQVRASRHQRPQTFG